MTRLEPLSQSADRAARLTFCCELPTAPLGELFAEDAVIEDLRALGAEVSLATIDLSEERASVVRRLDEAGIPVIAWLVTERSEGYFAHLDNAPEVAARYAAVREWAERNGLRLAAVALDIEPPIEELEALASPRRWRILRRWLARVPDMRRYANARRTYQDLVARMQEDGYRTEAYQFGFTVEDRAAGSTLLQRLFGILDLRVDREWLMLYSSLLRSAAVGMLWTYARGRARPVVGSTVAVESVPAITWEAFSRDLRLARRWGGEVGVYSLEGCVRNGWLQRLLDFDWDAPVERPRAAVVTWAGLGLLRSVLWAVAHRGLALVALAIGSRLPRRRLLAAALAAMLYTLTLRPRLRRTGATPQEAEAALPGDDIVRYPRVQHTRAIAISAPAAEVWPWLVQMGFGRAGYYYPSWVDAIWGWLIRRRYRDQPWYSERSVVNRNVHELVPQLQHLTVGDRILDGPDGYFEVRRLIPDRAIVLYSARHPLSGRPVEPGHPAVGPFVDFSWAFVLEPTDERSCRLLVRLRADHTPGPLASALVAAVVEPADLLLQTMMLRSIKRHAEMRLRGRSMTVERS